MSVVTRIFTGSINNTQKIVSQPCVVSHWIVYNADTITRSMFFVDDPTFVPFWNQPIAQTINMTTLQVVNGSVPQPVLCKNGLWIICSQPTTTTDMSVTVWGTLR